jgi:hypothetical protein
LDERIEALKSKIGTSDAMMNLIRRLAALLVAIGLVVGSVGGDILRPVAYGVAALVFSAAVLILLMAQAVNSTNQTEVDALERKRENTLGLAGMSTRKESSYFDELVRINVNNLEAYYVMVKTHAGMSFSASLLVGVLGFLLVSSGLIIGFFVGPSQQFVSYISAGAGLILEIIAGGLFNLHSKTIRQLKDYHDSLLSGQNILLAFKIVGDTQNEQLKAEMMSHMLGYLIGKPAPSVKSATSTSNPDPEKIRAISA